MSAHTQNLSRRAVLGSLAAGAAVLITRRDP